MGNRRGPPGSARGRWLGNHACKRQDRRKCGSGVLAPYLENAWQMTAPNSILDSFLAAQGYALFEYSGNGVFRPIGEYPKWCENLWKGSLATDKSIHLGEASPLLENFLIDAEGFWNSNREGSANSPVWIERDATGRD